MQSQNAETRTRGAGIQPWHIAVLIFACSAYLAFMGLDHAYFWDDEAEVGIIAKNFLATGKLTGWDGRNLFAYHLGTTLDPNLRPINPPLQYLVAAASFKVFGLSTWAGRLPFVLFGLASLALFARIVRHEFKGQGTLWVYALAVFGLSMEFLLNARQCRYYSLALFFTLLTFYFYRRTTVAVRMTAVLDTPAASSSLAPRGTSGESAGMTGSITSPLLPDPLLRCAEEREQTHSASAAASACAGPLDFILLAVSAALLFYSHYLLCAVFLASLAVTHVVFYWRDTTKHDWLKFAFAAAVFALLTVPYAVRFRIWVRPDVEKTSHWLQQKLQFTWWNFRELNTLNCLPWLLVIGVVYFLVRERKNEWVKRHVWSWLALGVGYMLFLALRSELAETQEAPMRYFLPPIPFFALVIAAFLWFVHQRQRFLAVALCAAAILTNAFSLAPGNSEFRWLLPAYVKEVHQEYPTSYRSAAEFLRKNVKTDANIVCFPEFCTYPLMFYCGDNLRFGCLLDTREAVAKQKYFSLELLDSLKGPLFLDEHYPDYFIAFGKQEGAMNLLNYFSRPHEENYRAVRYDYRFVTNLPVFWYDTSRPELPRHSFGPKKDFEPDNEGVFIFERSSAQRVR